MYAQTRSVVLVLTIAVAGGILGCNRNTIVGPSVWLFDNPLPLDPEALHRWRQRRRARVDVVAPVFVDRHGQRFVDYGRYGLEHRHWTAAVHGRAKSHRGDSHGRGDGRHRGATLPASADPNADGAA